MNEAIELLPLVFMACTGTSLPAARGPQKYRSLFLWYANPEVVKYDT
jgi:hypothetical protein